MISLMQSCSYLQSNTVFVKNGILVPIMCALQQLTRSYLQSFSLLPLKARKPHHDLAAEITRSYLQSYFF